QSLGYFGVCARNLNDWESFATRSLGMQLVDRSRATLSLRMDDRRQRVVVEGDGEEGTSFFGFEVADGAALDRLAARLEAARIPVARGSRALADQRHVAELIAFRDPAGNRLEAFH